MNRNDSVYPTKYGFLASLLFIYLIYFIFFKQEDQGKYGVLCVIIASTIIAFDRRILEFGRDQQLLFFAVVAILGVPSYHLFSAFNLDGAFGIPFTVVLGVLLHFLAKRLAPNTEEDEK